MTVLVKAHAGFYGRVRVLSDLTYCWPVTGAASQVKKMYIYIYIYIYLHRSQESPSENTTNFLPYHMA